MGHVHTTTVIVGAGHAGLAMSRRLTERSIDHVVLERGEVANSWRTERWDSLRLLTPNWLTRLPGQAYGGDDPDSYMTVPEVIDLVAGYASAVSAPVHTRTRVTSVRPARAGSGYEVVSDQGTWTCRSVVLASGACNIPAVPSLSEAVPVSLATCTSMSYRGPGQLDGRGVLVVGASATGVQLADEIHRSGRPVTLSVGEHVRLPRTYRGRDIFWWMHAAGVLDERYDQVDDIVRARHVPSAQLIGTPERASVDLSSLAARGVRVVGRLGRIDRGVAQFSGSLVNQCRLADLKMKRLLSALDDWAVEAGVEGFDGPPERPDSTHVAPAPLLELDLNRGEIGTIVWATGYRPDYSWLDLPVLDRKGRVRHDGGVVLDAPGVYLLGANFLRRRRSSFIDGAAADTRELSAHLHRHLDCVVGVPRPRRPRLSSATGRESAFPGHAGRGFRSSA